MKARDFFGETSRQTFVTRVYLLVPIVFGGTNTLFFFIRTSNFLAEAEPELNVLIFLAI